MALPVVSVVIPCYNAVAWIADAIHSALAQTYSPVEVVVVDDGSTDGSREIIQSFDGRIRFDFLNHGGAPKARNRGLKLVSGEFIQFLDADDILFPHCVGRKVQTILREEADIVFSGGFFFDERANAGHYEPQIPLAADRASAVAQIIASSIQSSWLMCRKPSLESIGGFDETLNMGQEHDLLVRLALRGFKLAHVPEPLSLNRTGHNPYSITTITAQNPIHLETLMRRFEERLANSPVWTSQVRMALARRFHGIGVRYLAIRNKKEAIKMFRHARKITPLYSLYLPRSRQYLVPLIGGYLSERFLSGLRHLFPRRSYKSYAA